jgi:hypothetical protein
MPLDSRKLQRLSKEELDELFAKGSSGNLPEGEGTGTALLCPGTIWGRLFAWITRWFVWQGDVFRPAEGYVRSRLSPFGFQAQSGNLFKDKSRLEDKESIVMDYRRGLPLPGGWRDEIREVAPGLFLGLMIFGQKRGPRFALSFQYQPARNFWRRVLAIAGLLAIVGLFYLTIRFQRDQPVGYSNLEEHFKYGSTGGERESGIPYWIWKVLPKMFPEYLPGKTYNAGKEYASFGFLYEPGKDLPIGVSRRNTQGIDRVFLNCAICHDGSVRETPQSTPAFYSGMPSNTVDLEAFERFIFACASDQRFNAPRIMAEMEAIGGKYDLINRLIMRYYAIPFMRERLLMLQGHFRFVEWEPDAGPGRTDTFNPAKTLLEFPLEQLETRELVGLCDFPSIWLQGARKQKNIHAHWDGNNSMMEERNKSAAFGTGTFPPSIDLKQVARVEQWLLSKEPPKYPFAINQSLAARGAPLYAEYCASCHGKSGHNFSGEYVGQVVPIAQIGTDRHRLDSYTHQLAASQNNLYAGYPWRFSHFRKTYGYANMPLDGIWARAPYLHNGSVPTMRDLLNPTSDRPQVFYRGYDVYDQVKMGFVSDVSHFNEDGTSKDDPASKQHFFRYETQLRSGATPRERNEGNLNTGHEGERFGTMLSPDEKDALVEYLKTF